MSHTSGAAYAGSKAASAQLTKAAAQMAATSEGTTFAGSSPKR